MEDLLEAAIDAILSSADGDSRLAMRAMLIENLRLQAELNRRNRGPHNEIGGTKTVLH